MYSVSQTFNNFLLNFGIINEEGVNYMTNIDDIDSENFEPVLIENLRRFLISCKNNHSSLVDNMYEKFILNDDRMIIKAIRRLIVIYADKLRITKQRVFYNWLGRVFQKKERPNVKDAPEMKCVYKRKIIPLKEEEKSEPSFSLQLNSPKSYQGSSRIEISKADNFEIKKPTVKPHERLYKDKFKRQEMLNEIISKYQNSEIKECTFTPQITRTKSMRSIKSQKEFNKIQHDEYINRENRLRQLSVEREKYLSTVYTFEPQINNGKVGVEGDFFLRMKNFQTSKQKKMKRIKDELHRNIPKPKIYPTRSKNNSFVLGSKEDSINLEGKARNVLVPSTFETNLNQVRQEKLKKIEMDIMKEKGITFKPKLNDKINKNINSSLIERNDEFVKSKINKLNQILNKDDAECTFSPKINSTEIKSEVKVGDRLFDYQKKYTQKREEKKDLYKEEYSFKPEISKNTNEILKQRELTLNLVKQKYSPPPIESKASSDVQRYQDNTPFTDEAQVNYNNLVDTDRAKDNDLTTNRKTFTFTNSNQEVVDQLNQLSVSLNKGQSIDALQKTSMGNSIKISSQIPLQSVSDSQLMEKANNFITTDESLQRFQKGIKDKYKNVAADRNHYVKVIDNTLKEKMKMNKTFKEVTESTSKDENTSIRGNYSSTKSNSKSKNKSLTKNMDYYDNIDI